MKYCTGTIRNMYVKNIGVNEEAGKIVTDNMIIKKDAPFYINRVGRLISLDYDTFLPTRTEAEAFVVGRAKNFPDHLELATCLYADYGCMETHQISRKEFKELKKTYKLH